MQKVKINKIKEKGATNYICSSSSFSRLLILYPTHTIFFFIIIIFFFFFFCCTHSFSFPSFPITILHLLSCLYHFLFWISISQFTDAFTLPDLNSFHSTTSHHGHYTCLETRCQQCKWSGTFFTTIWSFFLLCQNEWEVFCCGYSLHGGKFIYGSCSFPFGFIRMLSVHCFA